MVEQRIRGTIALIPTYVAQHEFLFDDGKAAGELRWKIWVFAK
jgi:hypothetical protein